MTRFPDDQMTRFLFSCVPFTRQSQPRCRVIIRARFSAVSYKYYVLLNSLLLLCGVCAPAAAQESTAATVQGTVFNKVSGAPVNHAHVMYIKSAAGANDNLTPISTDTDSEGHFLIQVEPGTYRLCVERPGFAR